MAVMGSDSDNLKIQIYVKIIWFKSGVLTVHPVQLYYVWPTSSLERAHLGCGWTPAATNLTGCLQYG